MKKSAAKPASRSPRKTGRTIAAKPKGEPAGWRRAKGDRTMILQLGARVRAVRESKSLSLAQLSEKCGIPGATLSRIENSKMSPTFGVLARVMTGLDIDWVDLVGPKPLAPGERVMSFAEPAGGRATKVRGFGASILHSHHAARSLPILADVQAHELAEAGGLTGHRGEEFCYVLSGKLILHMEGRPPRVLRAGASALFDSEIPHAYLAGSARGAKILIVVNRGAGSFNSSAESPLT